MRVIVIFLVVVFFVVIFRFVILLGLALAAVAQRKDLRCQCRGILDSFGACAMVRLAGSGNESARNAMMITGEVTFSPLSGLLT